MSTQAGHPEEQSLLEFAYGELAPDQARSFEAHLADCARCRDELHAIRQVRASMGRLPIEDAPPSGLDSLLAYAQNAADSRQRKPRRYSSLWAWAGAVSTAALLVVGTVAVKRTSMPEQLAHAPAPRIEGGQPADVAPQAEAPRPLLAEAPKPPEKKREATHRPLRRKAAPTPPTPLEAYEGGKATQAPGTQMPGTEMESTERRAERAQEPEPAPEAVGRAVSAPVAKDTAELQGALRAERPAAAKAEPYADRPRPVPAPSAVARAPSQANAAAPSSADERRSEDATVNLRARNDLEDEAQALRKALASGVTGEARARVLLRLCEIESEMGEPAVAKSRCERVLREHPSSPYAARAREHLQRMASPGTGD